MVMVMPVNLEWRVTELSWSHEKKCFVGGSGKIVKVEAVGSPMLVLSPESLKIEVSKTAAGLDANAICHTTYLHGSVFQFYKIKV